MGTENRGEELEQKGNKGAGCRKEHGESQAEDYLLHLIEIPMQVPFGGAAANLSQLWCLEAARCRPRGRLSAENRGERRASDQIFPLLLAAFTSPACSFGACPPRGRSGRRGDASAAHPACCSQEGPQESREERCCCGRCLTWGTEGSTALV